MRLSMLLLMLVPALAAADPAEEQVTVAGSKTKFPVRIEAAVAGKPVKMVLTGAAMRRRLVNVYAVASYVKEGVAIKTAEELATVNCPRRLELVLQRDVTGKEMAEAFKAGVRLNHPEPAFAEEIAGLCKLMEKLALERHDRVVLTNIPGVGLHCIVGTKTETLLKNERFANAIWEIYLGKMSISDDVKKNLFSRF